MTFSQVNLNTIYPESASTGHAWFIRTCGGIFDNLVQLPAAASAAPGAPGAAPAAPVVDVAALAREAASYLPLPAPAIRTSPNGDQVVNLRSWLWIDESSFRPVSSTVSVPSVSVTVTATPTKVTWQTGDGATVVCSGPGRPYDSSLEESAQSTDCGHTYRQSSAHQPGLEYRVTATTEWQASFAVSGAPGGGVLPTISRSSTVGVRVGEIQAVNTPTEQGG